jgi:hypothetical protein
MQLEVRSTKLFYDGNEGEAPAGSTRTVNLLENAEFLAKYGHCPINRLPEYAAEMVARWNRLQPKNWRYELILTDVTPGRVITLPLTVHDLLPGFRYTYHYLHQDRIVYSSVTILSIGDGVVRYRPNLEGRENEVLRMDTDKFLSIIDLHTMPTHEGAPE